MNFFESLTSRFEKVQSKSLNPISYFNKSDQRSLWLNVATPIVASLLLNGLIFKKDWDQHAGVKSKLLPPGPVIGGIWVVLLGAMGGARWASLKSNKENSKSDANLIAGLIGLSLAYPFYTRAFKDKRMGLLGSLFTATATSWLAQRLQKNSHLAAALVAPTVPWVTYASAGVIDELYKEHQIPFLH